MAPRSNLLPLGIVVTLAALLAALSIPSLMAAMIAKSSDVTIERIRERRLPPPMVMLDAARAQSLAAFLFESARYNSNAAAALLELSPTDRARSGFDAERLVTQSLMKAPASPHNWARLAYMRLVKGDRAGAIKAWQMSVLVGRYVPNIMANRLAIAFAMFPTTDEEFINLVTDQVQLEAEVDIEGLAWLARQREASPFIRAVLWHDAEKFQAFKKAYEGLLWRERNPSQ